MERSIEIGCDQFVPKLAQSALGPIVFLATEGVRHICHTAKFEWLVLILECPGGISATDCVALDRWL